MSVTLVIVPEQPLKITVMTESLGNVFISDMFLLGVLLHEHSCLLRCSPHSVHMNVLYLLSFCEMPSAIIRLGLISELFFILFFFFMHQWAL